MCVIMTEAFEAERMDDAGKYQLTQKEWDNSLYVSDIDGRQYIVVSGPSLWPASLFYVVDKINQYDNKVKSRMEERETHSAKCQEYYNRLRDELLSPVATVEEITRIDDNWEYTEVWHSIDRTEDNTAAMQYMIKHRIDWGVDYYPNGIDKHSEFMFMDENKIYYMTVTGRYTK